jgi:hypothetical protein
MQRNISNQEIRKIRLIIRNSGNHEEKCIPDFLISRFIHISGNTSGITIRSPASGGASHLRQAFKNLTCYQESIFEKLIFNSSASGCSVFS